MSIADTNDKDKSESLMELTAQVENFVRHSAAEGCGAVQAAAPTRTPAPPSPPSTDTA